MPTYALPDGGTAYEWPTSMPDGWALDQGAWNVGLHDQYGAGFDAGAPLRCMSGMGSIECPGLVGIPNGSALLASVCFSYNGGCDGSTVIRSARFQVGSDATYLLSMMLSGRLDLADTSGTVPSARLHIHVDWFAGSTLLGTATVDANPAISLDWTEFRALIISPVGATVAQVRVEPERAKRQLLVDEVALTPQ